ncbi:MAG: AIR synthase related protein [Chitinophagaceae bacterium]
MSLYSQRGVSAQKEEVHKATAHLDKGLYPYAFCKIYADYLGGDADWVNIMHADGAGTKSILAYLYWRETGDISVWKGIAQDAIVMNLDDLLCTGIYDNLLFSSTIDRNKKIIPGEVLEEIINGTQEFFEAMRPFGVNIHYLGGETADVGDVVRTIAVNGTMTARWPKNKLVTNDRIQAGDVIIGLASAGQSEYEKTYNSGLASNGLTSARHDILSKIYAHGYPETFEPSLLGKVVYAGPYRLTDEITINTGEQNQVPGMVARDLHPEKLTIGQLLLSPTRTYAPVMKALFDSFFDNIHGLVHCSGGGQTKCMKYLPGNFRIIKDNLFTPPPIFRLIQQSSGADDKEMYQVFNMGHRMEIFAPQEVAAGIINLSLGLGIDARIVGRVEPADKKELLLKTSSGQVSF